MSSNLAARDERQRFWRVQLPLLVFGDVWVPRFVHGWQLKHSWIIWVRKYHFLKNFGKKIPFSSEKKTFSQFTGNTHVVLWAIITWFCGHYHVVLLPLSRGFVAIITWFLLPLSRGFVAIITWFCGHYHVVLLPLSRGFVAIITWFCCHYHVVLLPLSRGFVAIITWFCCHYHVVLLPLSHETFVIFFTPFRFCFVYFLLVFIYSPSAPLSLFSLFICFCFMLFVMSGGSRYTI